MSVYWKDRLFVATQFLLMFLYVSPISLGYFESFRVIGLVLVSLGALVGIAAIWQLRHSISPFPSPKANARLIDQGVFKWVRHPIYTGILLAALGYSLFSGSLWKSMITLALLLLFQFKARYEEQLLQGEFEFYAQYKSKTGRFLPRVRK